MQKLIIILIFVLQIKKNGTEAEKVEYQSIKHLNIYKMNKEEMKSLVNDYRLGFITGLELVSAYMSYKDDNPEGFSQAASDILYEADELLRPLSRKIEKEIDNL